MDDAAVAWLRRLVSRALDVEPAVFDAMLASKPHQTSFRTADNQLEVTTVGSCDAVGRSGRVLSVVDVGWFV